MLSDHKHYAYLNDEFLPQENAYLHVSDLAIQRGYGIFDYFKLHEGQPLFLDHYLTRFYGSALMMGLTVPLKEGKLRAVLQKLIQMNSLPEAGIKLILTGGYSTNGYEPAEPNLIILQQPLTMPSDAQVTNGIKIITHPYVRELAAAKTINYSMGIRLIQQIQSKGADDVLYHQNGVVSEFPRSNFFLVTKDNRVITPAQEVLKGITRKNVLEIAARKYTAEEGEVTLGDIAQAKEVFMTSTTKRVLPIVEIDGKMIGDGKPGAISLDLLQELIALENRLVHL